MSQKLEKFIRYKERYERLVMTNIRNFVEAQLVEDITQETFLKMYVHLDYLTETSVKAWLLVVSANLARDYAKKGGACEEEPMTPQEIWERCRGTGRSAEEAYLQSEERKAALELLQAAGNMLYEKNPRWYFVLIDGNLLGMSSEQIGQVLNISPLNVDVIKTRARKFLREKLGKAYHELL